MASAAVTTLSLVALSSVAFGWGLWAEWLSILPSHAEHVDKSVNSYYKPTLRGALLLAGAAPELARAVPMLVMAVAAPLVWWCFQKRSPLAVAALVAGSFAAMPYVFLYDLPAVTGAAIMALAARPRGVAMVILFALIVWRTASWRSGEGPGVHLEFGEAEQQ